MSLLDKKMKNNILNQILIINLFIMIHFTNKSCFLIGRNRKTPQPLLVASDKVGFGLKAEDVLAIVSYNLVFALNAQAANELKKIADKSLCLYDLPDYCFEADFAACDNDFRRKADMLCQNGCKVDEKQLHQPVLWFLAEPVWFYNQNEKPKDYLLAALIYLNRDSFTLKYSMNFDEARVHDIIGFVLDDFVFSLNTVANCMFFEMVRNEKCLFRATKDGEYGVGRKVTQTPEFSKLINILQNYCVIDNSVYLPFLRWKTDNSEKLIF